MDDDEIIRRGGDDYDIAAFAEQNGATDPFVPSTEDLWTEIRTVSREAVNLRESRSRLNWRTDKDACIRLSQALRKKEQRHRELRQELIKRGEIKEGKPRWEK